MSRFRTLDLEVFARTQADAEMRGAEAATAYFGGTAWLLAQSSATEWGRQMDGSAMGYTVRLSYYARGEDA